MQTRQPVQWKKLLELSIIIFSQQRLSNVCEGVQDIDVRMRRMYCTCLFLLKAIRYIVT